MTPQEKKLLSLLYDRRNTYGESSKGSRKTIPRNKRIRARLERRAIKRWKFDGCDGGESAALAFSRAAKVRKMAWTKMADTPLGEVIQGIVKS